MRRYSQVASFDEWPHADLVANLVVRHEKLPIFHHVWIANVGCLKNCSS